MNKPDYKAMAESVGGLASFIAAIQRLEDRIKALEQEVRELRSANVRFK